MEKEKSTTLFQSGTFVYEVLTQEYKAEAEAVQAAAFTFEPCVAFCNPDEKARLRQWRAFANLFSEECASNGLSVVCLDTESDNRVAGVFWVRDFKSPLQSDFDGTLKSKCPDIVPLIDVLCEVDALYEESRAADEAQKPLDGEGRLVDLWMLAVHPDYHRRGIGRAITQVALKHSLTKFPEACIETTGDYSARCAQRAGMRLSAEVPFATAKQQALAGTPAPHDAMRFWVLRAEELFSGITRS